MQDPKPVQLAPVQQPAQIDRLQRAVDEGAHYQREALNRRIRQLDQGAVVRRRKIGKRQQAAQVAAQHHAGGLSAGPGPAAECLHSLGSPCRCAWASTWRRQSSWESAIPAAYLTGQVGALLLQAQPLSCLPSLDGAF